jgi:TIR domain
VRNFFISYTKTDKPWAEWLNWFLEDKGFSTFVQFKDIVWGHNFIVRMDDGLKEADRLITILSPEFLRSGFTKAEWTAVFAKDPDGEKGLLLPVRVRECDLSGLLLPGVYLDLVGLDEAQASKRLAEGLAQVKAVPAGPDRIDPKPPFPSPPKPSGI